MYIFCIFIDLSLCLIVSEWMKPSRGRVSSTVLIFGRARFTLSDFYSISLFNTYTRDFHRAQRTDVTTFVCSDDGFLLSHGVYVCVCVCEYCRSLTILWMNRSPRMFLNVWASSVICIFVINLCYSTVNKITLTETLVDRTPLLSVITALQM